MQLIWTTVKVRRDREGNYRSESFKPPGTWAKFNFVNEIRNKDGVLVSAEVSWVDEDPNVHVQQF